MNWIVNSFQTVGIPFGYFSFFPIFFLLLRQNPVHTLHFNIFSNHLIYELNPVFSPEKRRNNRKQQQQKFFCDGFSKRVAGCAVLNTFKALPIHKTFMCIESNLFRFFFHHFLLLLLCCVCLGCSLLQFDGCGAYKNDTAPGTCAVHTHTHTPKRVHQRNRGHPATFKWKSRKKNGGYSRMAACILCIAMLCLCISAWLPTIW